MTQKRKLGMIETYVKFFYEAANGTTGLTAVVQVAGPLTADLIKQSLELLQKRHPLLRATLSRAEDGSDCFEVDENPQELPFDIQERKSPRQWYELYEQRLNETFIDKQRYLWRITLLLGGNGQEHELVACFHHTVMDGKSFGNFFRDLLAYVQIIAGNGDPSVEPLPLMPNLEMLLDKEVSWADYLKAGETGFANLVAMKDQLFSYEKKVPLPERTSKVISEETDEAQLERLISRCRENKTVLTGLLYAALLMSFYKVKGGAEGQSGRRQLAVTPVDMRTNCRPVIGPEHIGNYVSVTRTVHYTDRDTSFWELARSCEKEIRKGIEEQAYFPREYDSAVFEAMLGAAGTGPLEGKYSLGPGVTNYGVLDLPLEFGPFQVKKFHSGAIRHAGDWIILLHATSVGGRLWLDFCYEMPLLSEENARKIVQEFMSTLASVIDGKI